MKKTHGLIAAATLAALGIATNANAVSAYNVGAGTLISPSAADTWYCTQNPGCSTPATHSFPITNARVEITALADALHNNVDLIYEYVRNNIETVPMYGLQKGALGALIDKSGTAFDQAQLMVELLLASGYSSGYVGGTITLNASQANAMFGTTNAAALRLILADGGIPATVSGSGGIVTSITMSTLWVRVTIGGANYYFDPSNKPHTFTAGIDIGAASGFSESSFISSAQSGMASGTQTGRWAGNPSVTVSMPYTSKPNAANINAQLDSAANTLVNYLRTNGYAAKQLEDIVGRQDIQPHSGGQLRQTSLPSSSTQHVFSGEIPDVYRTKVTIEMVRSGDGAVLLTQSVFADEIYGRRVSYDSYVSPGSPPWSDDSVQLRVDNVDVGARYTGTDLPNNRARLVRLSIDHPYASDSGTYMDATGANAIVKMAHFISPVMIVLGLGETSPALQAKLGSEQALDKLLPNSVYYRCSGFGEGGTGCEIVDKPQQPGGETGLMRSYSGWLAQYSRTAMMQSRMLNGVHQQHHTLGVAFRFSYMTVTHPKQSPAGACGACWSVGQGATVIDIDTAASVNSKTNVAADRRSLSLSLAATADTLEGLQFEEAGSATPASVAHRYQWGTSNNANMRYYLLTQAATSMDLFPNGTSPYFYNSIGGTTLNYTEAGYKVIAAQDSFMGPGRNCATPTTPCPSSQSVIYTERGGAFQAFAADGVSSANVVTNGFGFSFKGGSAGSPPQYDEAYSPDKSSDLLKDQFKDHSRDMGVDLASGEYTYTPPADVSVGLGEFPYKLDFQRSFKSGESHSPGLGKGWSHNLDIRANLTTSGAEALGQSSVLPSASALVALYATQRVYATKPGTDAALLKRWVLAPFAQSWWLAKVRFNVVTHTAGSATKTFVKLPDGTFNPPGGYDPKDGSSTWNLLQAGAPTGYGEKWLFGGVSFSLTSPSKDVQSIGYWGRPNRDLAVPYLYGPHHGWHITNWSFPQGVSLTFGYVPVDLVTYVDDHLAFVQNSLGRKLNFSFASNSYWDICNFQSVNDDQGHAATYDCSTASITSPTGDVARVVYGPTPTDRSRRPRPSPYITDVFDVSSASLAKIKIGYDAANRVRTVADAVAIATPAARNPYTFYITGGTRGERQDPSGNLYTVYYDQWSRATQFINELGFASNAVYDGLGRVTKRTSAENIITEFQYNGLGNVTQIKQTPKSTPYPVSANLIVSATYDPGCAKVKTVTDAKNNTTTWTYNQATCQTSNVQQPSVIDGKTGVAATPTTSYTYTSVGLVDTITDPSGMLAKFSYDTSGNRTLAQTDPYGLNAQKSYGYDGVGNITSVTSGRGISTSYVYDGSRRLTRITGPAPCAVSENIWVSGLVTKVRNAKVCAPDFASDADWQVWLKAYTATDKIRLETDPDGGTVLTSYDSVDRPEYVTQSVGGGMSDRVTRTQYDAVGQIYRVYKGWGSSDQITYAEYAYSPDGRQISVKDANQNLTTIVYDGYGRPTRTNFPDSSYEQLSYDDNGNVTSKRNRSGVSLTIGFDALNREISRIVPDNPAYTGNYARTLSTTYDLASRKWDLTAESQTLRYRYDAAGRIASVGDSLLNTLGSSYGDVGYSYDASGNRASVGFTTAQGTWIANYDYDAGERLWHVTSSGSPIATFGYDTLSRPSTLTYWDATSVGQAYEADDDLQTLTNTFSGGNLIIGLNHNGAHQIKSQSVSDVNFLMKQVGAGKSYGVNNLNQYTQVNSIPLNYDTNGNLINDGTWTYSYDEENRLRRAVGNGITADYAYDPAGRRRSKTVNGTTTYFVYDSANELAELSATGNRLRFYVNGGAMDSRIAMYDDTGTGWLFYHTNHQGSVLYTTRLATGGAIQDSYSYGPYGEPTSTQSATGNPFRYTGRYLDGETGLYYYRARYYSAQLGRFLQTDPIGSADDNNLYYYGHNDPVNESDPSGECPPINDTTPCSGKQIASEVAAYTAISAVTDTKDISPAANKMLKDFKSGEGDANQSFGPDSQETKELTHTSYMQSVTSSLTDKLAAANGGTIPDGAAISGTGRDFNPLDAAIGMVDGIDVSDVVGTISTSITVTASGNMLTFTGSNRTTLESFAGGNLLKTKGIVNPTSGRLATKTQTFTWKVPVPPKYTPN